MSTNFYAHTATTPAGEDGLHIGQRAYPFEFLFRAYPGLSTTEDWHRYLTGPGITIISEAGVKISVEAFWPAATARPAQVDYPMRLRWQHLAPRFEWRWRDHNGYPFANYEFC